MRFVKVVGPCLRRVSSMVVLVSVSVLGPGGSRAAELPSAGLRGVITEIGTLRTDGQGASIGTAINEAGDVVGYATDDNREWAPFRLRAGGSMENLGFFISASFSGYAFGVNSAGVAVGRANTQAGGFAEAFRMSEGGLVGLGWLAGGGDSDARGINVAGTVVGWSNRAIGCGAPECNNNPGYAVRWVNGSIDAIGGLGGFFSVATGINDRGDICGYGATPSNLRHGFRLAAGTTEVVDLGTLGGGASYAAAINANGQIVGSAQTTDNIATHGAIWIENSAEDLGALDGKAVNEASGISSNGIIVGYAVDADGTSNQRAVVFRRGGTPVDLNSYIDPASGWVLLSAAGVNSSGVVVGAGLQNGVSRGFILTLPPRLQIALSSATQVRVSWPINAAGYKLESALETPTSSWGEAPEVPTVVGLENVVNANVGIAPRFFRLRKP